MPCSQLRFAAAVVALSGCQPAPPQSPLTGAMNVNEPSYGASSDGASNPSATTTPAAGAPLQSPSPTLAAYPFRDPTLSVSERAKNLVSLLSIDEKIAQMVHDTPAIERLGVPAYSWWNEALHGVARDGR